LLGNKPGDATRIGGFAGREGVFAYDNVESVTLLAEIQREPDWWDPLPVDRMVELYEGSDIQIMISVVGAPEWALDPDREQLVANWENFVGFMAFMAERYQGRVHAWEIWNEQNMAHEMHGTVRISDNARRRNTS
jgi:hypothetical protein